MKHTTFGLAAALGLALLASAPVATGSIYGAGEGYYYVARSYTGNYPNPYQYMKVGPFDEEADCWQDWNNESNDLDSWYPYVGTGIQCDWLFHSEVSSFDDALDAWNTIVGGGGNPHVEFGVAELQDIAQLQQEYQIERYERAVIEVLRPVR